MSENHQDTTASTTPTTQPEVSVPSEKEEELPKSKLPTTLDEWIKLLGTPLTILIAVGGLIWGVYQFNAQQKDSADMQATQVAASQTQTVDQQQEITLQTYIANIQDLLLSDNLLKSKSTDNVAIIARVRTLITLRRLNAERNKIVLRFLQDAHLIGIQDAVINLSNGFLSGADLSGTDLSGTDLSDATLDHATLDHASLSDAILNGANLSDANLSDAILSGVDLSGANLSGANLSGANLSGATLKRAILSGAILDYTILSGAILSGANLSGADLNGAILDRADLSDATLISAHLSGADLNGATLSDAYLSGADLNGASLSGADLSRAELQGAKYNVKTLQMKGPQGPFTLGPTQWPQGFSPQAAGAICVDC